MGGVLGFEYEPAYAELVRKIFHGDAPGGVVPPGIILASERGEWEILRGEILFQSGRTHGAIAGRFGFIDCREPNADMISVVTEIWITNLQAAATVYRIVYTLNATPAADETANGRAGVRDGGRGTGFQPSTIVGEGDDAAGFGGIAVAVPANQTAIFRPQFGWVLRPAQRGLPASILLVQTNVVNVAIDGVQFFGYERRMRDEERMP